MGDNLYLFKIISSSTFFGSNTRASVSIITLAFPSCQIQLPTNTQPGEVGTKILLLREQIRCFKVHKNHIDGYLKPHWKPVRCLYYCAYMVNAEYSLCYLRITTWAPFRLQFYFNGHDWLYLSMAKEAIKYRKADNCFVHISDFEHAQSIVDSFNIKCLHRHPNQLTSRFIAVANRLHHC